MTEIEFSLELQSNIFYTVVEKHIFHSSIILKSVLFSGSNKTINENLALKFILKSRRNNIFRSCGTSIIMFKLKIIEKAEVMSHDRNFHVLESLNGH